MDTNTSSVPRVIDLLGKITQLQALKTTYLVGPYKPECVSSTVEDLGAEIAELEEEIVETVKELEARR